MKRLIRKLKKYFTNRDTTLVLAALPAIVVIGIWIFFGFFIAGWGQSHTEARYREVAGRSMASRDYETARVSYWRLVSLKSEKRSEYLFGLALGLLGLGREQEAQGILVSLAPLDRPGYGEAHLYVAQRLLSSTNAPPDAARLAELHLLRAIEANPKLLDAHNILGQIYTRQGKYDAAKKHLLEVVGTKGETTLLLALVLRAQGDESGATAYAERAAKFFAERTAQATGDDPGARIAWANALLMLKDYENALKVLQDGYTQSGNAIYPPAMGSLYAVWAQAVGRDKPTALAQRLSLVQNGLRYAPQSETLIRELVEVTRGEGLQADEARTVIQRTLAEGGISATMLHFFLGTDAWKRGKKEEAQQHFDLAFEGASTVPAVANNMAMILADGDAADLERALQIIQPVIDRYPNNPSFLATRGTVFLRMKKFREAAGDLEASLPYMPNKRNTRMGLAAAYRGLGLEALAAQQAELAKRGD